MGPRLSTHTFRPPGVPGLPTRAQGWQKGHPSGDTVFDIQALGSSAFELELFLLLPEMRALLKLLMRLGALALSFQLCVNCLQLVIIALSQCNELTTLPVIISSLFHFTNN